MSIRAPVRFFERALSISRWSSTSAHHGAKITRTMTTGWPIGHSILMIDKEDPVHEVMLRPADFPRHFVDMAHPEDYIEVDHAITPEMFLYQGLINRRMICRVSFQLKDSMYVPITFVVDTGATFHFYLSERAQEVLGNGGRILHDGLSNRYMKVLGLDAAVHDTPSNHEPGNLLGLNMIQDLDWLQKDEMKSKDKFSFGKSFTHF